MPSLDSIVPQELLSNRDVPQGDEQHTLPRTSREVHGEPLWLHVWIPLAMVHVPSIGVLVQVAGTGGRSGISPVALVPVEEERP